MASMAQEPRQIILSRLDMDLKQLLFGQPKASVSMPAQVSGSTEEWLPVADISHGIIALKDGRFIKIIEILPVNFLLKTPAEKASIIYYYASYLKIAPDNLQICVLTKRADMSAYAERMRGYQNSEPNALCRELNEDNIREVEYLAENEALQKRILLVYQLEPGMKLREESIEAIGERMLEEEEKARNYLDMCGLEVPRPEYADNFQLQILYELLNPRTSQENPLPLTAFDAATPLAGVLLEDVEKNALPADENMGDAKSVPAAQDALSAASPDACTEEVAGINAQPFTGTAEAYSWDIGPIVHVPKKEARGKEKKKRFRREKKPRRTKTEKKPSVRETAAEQDLLGGRITVADLIAPAVVDRSHRDYIVVDRTYHAFLYIAGYGYETVVGDGWLAPLVEAGEGVNLYFYMNRQPREKILPKISQTTMLNRSRMRDIGDTRQDYEELDSAISSGLYIKNAMNRNNEDFYYMHTMIGVSAESAETLEQRISRVETLCASMSLIVKRCDYQHEQAFRSSLPLLSLDPCIARKARRNILTNSLAGAFPFSSFSINDPTGLMLGINLHNQSLCMIDPFDATRYEAPHIAVLGRTGAGKTMTLSCLALRLREQGVRVVIIAPKKGFEYRAACEAVGGKYIKLSPSSRDCINFMEIRKISLDPDKALGRLSDRGDSLLADKISALHAFFALRKPDATEEQRNYLDEALVRCYANFGITEENESLTDKNGRRKRMPTFADLYEVLQERAETQCYAAVLLRFVKGSARSLGGQTNVDLDASYVVIDISEIGKDLVGEGMLIGSEYAYDTFKEDRLHKKALICDELWALIGATSNAIVADYVLELVKLLRSYSTAFVNGTQDLLDYFALDGGKYGKAVLNACPIKIILPLEEDEARLVQKELNLSEEETMQIIRSRRGEGLLCAGHNRIGIAIRPTPKEYDLITTSREDLLRQAAKYNGKSEGKWKK
jgi:conjugal transfer ATP-binding protein TraC